MRTPNPREAVILNILINGERYGREIRDEYEARTGKSMPYGTLYTTLTRMEEEKGYIRSRMGEAGQKRGGNRRKYFRIDALGRTALNEYEIQLMTVWGKMARVGIGGGRC